MYAVLQCSVAGRELQADRQKHNINIRTVGSWIIFIRGQCVNTKRCGLLGAVLFAEMKFVLSDFLSMPVNQFKPVIQSRQMVPRAYCPELHILWAKGLPLTCRQLGTRKRQKSGTQGGSRKEGKGRLVFVKGCTVAAVVCRRLQGGGAWLRSEAEAAARR